jgi:hypothetical protein
MILRGAPMIEWAVTKFLVVFVLLAATPAPATAATPGSAPNPTAVGASIHGYDLAASTTTPSATSRAAGARGYDDHTYVSRGRMRLSGFVLAAKAAPDPPNRIYSARELRRRAAEPGPYHNFPESFNDEIFKRGTRTVTPGFFTKPRANLSNDSVPYRLPGEINGRSGTYEIFARPSASGRTEVITHRFFRPGPR